MVTMLLERYDSDGVYGMYTLSDGRGVIYRVWEAKDDSRKIERDDEADNG